MWQSVTKIRKMQRVTNFEAQNIISAKPFVPGASCDSYDDAVLVALNWIPWNTVLESYVLAINRIRLIQKMLQSTNCGAQ